MNIKSKIGLYISIYTCVPYLPGLFTITVVMLLLKILSMHLLCIFVCFFFFNISLNCVCGLYYRCTNNVHIVLCNSVKLGTMHVTFVVSTCL